MVWVVVKFILTDEIEVLPQKWLTEDDFALYPPYLRSKIEKAIKNEEEPNINLWQKYKIKLMSKQRFLTFSLASSKATKACNMSDISDREHEMPRKRQPKKKIWDSDDTSEHSDDSLKDFPLCPNKGVNDTFEKKGPSSQASGSSNSITSSFSSVSKISNSIFDGGSNERAGNVEGSLMVSGNPYPISGQLENTKGSLMVSGNPYPISGQVENKKGSLMVSGNPYPISGQLENKKDTFKTEVLGYLVKIKKVLKDHESQLRNIENCIEITTTKLDQIINLMKVNQTDSNLLVDVPNEDIVDVYNKLPINNEEELNQIEMDLSDGNSFKLMVMKLKKLGGNDFVDFLKRMLRKVMTNDVMQLYSLSGHKGKKKFNSTKIFAALKEAVQSQYSDITEKQIELKTSVFLSKAKERRDSQMKKNNE